MKKIFAIAVALVMAMVLSVSVFADAIFTLTEVATTDGGSITDGYTIVGWNPSVITQYMAPEVAADFITAIKTAGAKIVITYTGDADPDILLQAGDDGNYTWVQFNDCEIFNTADGKKQAVFDAAAAVAQYESKESATGEGTLSLDDFLNFGIGGEGNVVYLIEVVTGYEAPDGGDNAGDDNTGGDNTGDDNNGDDNTPADTGLALAVVPAVVALAAVAVSKKR